MKWAFIFLQPHLVNNTSIIENMPRNQQGVLVFKSTKNGWMKFKQRIDIWNQKQNFVGCKWSSKYSDIIVVQDPRSARPHDKFLKLDPGSPGIQQNILYPRSKIPRIPRQCYRNRIQDLQDPVRKWKYKIQDPSRSRILDPRDPGFRIFLGSWHVSVMTYLGHSSRQGIWHALKSNFQFYLSRSACVCLDASPREKCDVVKHFSLPPLVQKLFEKKLISLNCSIFLFVLAQ